jgi:hypothetical protein
MVITTYCFIFILIFLPDDQYRMFMKKRSLSLLCLVFLFTAVTFAQKKTVFKDTLDHAFDMSDYVINLHGFVPWPTIISEPALGSFGVGLAAVFITPKKKMKGDEKYHFPDITAFAGMYTINNTWGVGLFRQGTIPKIGMRYTVGLGYADANMEFYRTFQYLGEKKFNFKLKPIAAVVDISENLWKNKLFAGLRYEFTYTTIHYDVPEKIDTIFNVSENMITRIGALGAYLEFDSRNTIFTPDRGVRVKCSYALGRAWTASDEDIDKGDAFVNVFFQPCKWLVCGLRTEGQAVNDNVPFYYYPYLDMRGMPMMRYQGQQTILFETEERFDVTHRWSVLGFVGTGRTFSDSRFMDDKSWHWSGGAGFRYLIARLFKMRMGVDIAVGPGQFAYYIVLGHYWNR